MAKTWYKSTANGNISKSANGFQFVKTQSYSGFLGGTSVTTYYGMYSMAAGGWDDSYQNGAFDSPIYLPSGNVYGTMKKDPLSNTFTLGPLLGSIVPVMAYTVTHNINGNGSFSGDGDYISGSNVTIKATPHSGHVVVRLYNKSYTNPTTGVISQTISITSDVIVGVDFEPYYTIEFSAEGATYIPDNLSVCLADTTYRIPTNGAERTGYKFEGWTTRDDDVVEYFSNDRFSLGLDKFSAGEKFVLRAVWSQPKLTYDVNGGSTSNEVVIEGQKYYGEITLAEPISREGRVFTGWKIGNEIYPSGSQYTLSKDVTAIAQWNNISVKNSVPDAGTLSLYDISVNEQVAVESDNGFLMYNGVVGHHYRVDFTSDNIFYAPIGVYDNGKYVVSYEFTQTNNEFVLEFFWREKNLYSIEIESTPDKNSASVTSPTSSDKDGKYVEGREITITGAPAEGKKLKAAAIYNNDTGFPIGTGYEDIKNNTFTIPKLTSNIRVVCVFTDIDYKVKADIDDKSDVAISKVNATKNGQNVATAYFGDVVKFSVEDEDITFGYSFAGWYDISGNKKSEDKVFEYTVSGDVTLIAKAKINISLGVEYEDNRENPADELDQSCVLTVDNKEYARPFDIVLGESFSYELTLGDIKKGVDEKWKFKAWYEGETCLGYRRADTVTPTRSLNMVAIVTSDTVSHTLTVEFRNEESNAVIDNINGNMVSAIPATTNKVESSKVIMPFEGTQEVELTFVEDIAGGDLLVFSKVVDGDVTYYGQKFVLLVNSSRTITAYYGSLGERNLSIDFSDNSNRTMGEIAIDDKSSETDATPITVSKARGSKVEIRATSKNGYKFAGWYADNIGIGDPVSTDNAVELVVNTNRSLFAMFVQEPNAVYVWEGSSDRKMMEWRSKTYAGSKPFNLSACRIDTTGYPVSAFSVEMFSSPNTNATSVVKMTNIKSQESRRLPVRRPERYLQVAIENDQEVDAMYVGTSMGGLAV